MEAYGQAIGARGIGRLGAIGIRPAIGLVRDNRISVTMPLMCIVCIKPIELIAVTSS